jgi:hypothetical protein
MHNVHIYVYIYVYVQKLVGNRLLIKPCRILHQNLVDSGNPEIRVRHGRLLSLWYLNIPQVLERLVELRDRPIEV